MPPPDEEINPLAAALRRLAPQPAAFSRDALLFNAGKAAAVPRVPAWAWPTATGLFAGVSLVLGAFLLSPAEPGVQYVTVPQTVYVDRVVEVRVPAPASASATAEMAQEETGPDSAEARRMWQVRREVLRWGVEMLPKSKASAGPVSPPRDVQRGSFAPPGSFAIPGLPAPKKKYTPSAFEEELE